MLNPFFFLKTFKTCAIIIFFACGLISLSAYSQNTVQIERTFKVSKASQIVSPSETVEIIKDDNLPMGTVKVVLLVEHNANIETYNKVLVSRFRGVQKDTMIGFEVDQREITGRNGFALEEKIKTVVFMSSRTAKMK